jgi:hypothetical protein
MLPCGRIISIDPSRITEVARAIDLNIDVEITTQGNQIAGIPANSIVIRPVEHGEFGFEISFDITAEEIAEAGLNGNNVKLFYIDGDGKVTEYDKIRLNPDGSITVTISHSSLYVLSERRPGQDDDCGDCKFKCCKDCEGSRDCTNKHTCAVCVCDCAVCKPPVTPITNIVTCDAFEDGDVTAEITLGTEGSLTLENGDIVPFDDIDPDDLVLTVAVVPLDSGGTTTGNVNSFFGAVLSFLLNKQQG